MFGKVTIVWLHPFNMFNCLSSTNFHLLLCSRVTQRTTFKGRRFSICFLRSGGLMNMGQIDRFLLAVKYPVFKGRFWTYVPNRFNVGALSQAITTRQLRTFTRFTATHPKQRTGTGVGSREFNDVYYLIFRFISYQFISSFWLTLKNKANFKGHTHLDGTAFSRISSMIYSIDCVYIYIYVLQPRYCIITKGNTYYGFKGIIHRTGGIQALVSQHSIGSLCAIVQNMCPIF